MARMEDPNVEKIYVPKGVEKYREIDLKLLPGENVQRIIEMSPLSKMRTYIVCALLIFFAYTLHRLFSLPAVTVESLIMPAAAFLVLYFVWHCKVTEDLKILFFSLAKYALAVIVLSYFFTYFVSMSMPFLSNLLNALGMQSSTPSFSLNPVDNLKSLFGFIAGLLNSFVMKYASIGRLVALALMILGAVAALLTYLQVRGHLYYLTDRRIIVRRKFGTVQVTTLPIDSVVEVVAFQGFFGRLLGYGDVIVTMTSGGGVTESLRPRPVSPVESLYSVKRRLEGVKDVWQMKDAIIAAREKYVQAHYLEKMERDIRRLREIAEEQRSEKAKTSLVDERS